MLCLWDNCKTWRPGYWQRVPPGKSSWSCSCPKKSKQQCCQWPEWEYKRSISQWASQSMWVSWQMYGSRAVQCRPSCVELWVMRSAGEFGMHPSRGPLGWVWAGNAHWCTCTRIQQVHHRRGPELWMCWCSTKHKATESNYEPHH